VLKEVADFSHNVDVSLFVVAADIVGLAGASRLEDCPQSLCMVFNIQPVPNLTPVAVDGQRFACQGVQDHMWDELLGKLARAVVVGAVGDENRHAKGSSPYPDKMV